MLTKVGFEMKRLIALATALAMTVMLTACNQSVGTDTATADSTVQNTSSAVSEQKFDPYADENYDTPDGYDEKRDDVKYGKFVDNLTYHSAVIDRDKKFAVLFPPDYDENSGQKYPVIYALHGFGGNRRRWSYISTIYGNMIDDKIATPTIIVMPDMWTDTREYDDCTGEEQRASYDRFRDDLEQSLMPYVEENYPVLTGRKNTAIIGLSQGGTESLAIGFLMQDKFGYIASLAPATGAIPTEYFKGTYWNTPIMDDFVIDSYETMPYYILLTVGSLDPWDIDCTIYYGNVMTKNNIPHQYYMLDGAKHDNSMWSPSFYNFARRIFK